MSTVYIPCAGPGCASGLTVKTDQFDKVGESWLCPVCADKAHAEELLAQVLDMERADEAFKRAHGLSNAYQKGDDY